MKNAVQRIISVHGDQMFLDGRNSPGHNRDPTDLLNEHCVSEGIETVAFFNGG